MPKKMLALVFIGFVLISHVILPVFNRSEDFLLLSAWNMFSYPMAEVKDLSWDQGKTFLFRDHRTKAKEFGVRLHPLFYLLNQKNTEKIRDLHKERLKDFCQCDSIDFVVLKSDYYSHIIKKQNAEVILTERL